MAAVLVHDTVDRREPHAAAVPDLLSREERLEHALLDGQGDAAAGIGDGELDEITIDIAAAARADRRARPGMAHRDRDVPVGADCVARVDREVHQYLLQLDRIEKDRRGIVIQLGMQLDSRGKRRAQQLDRLLHERGERKGPRLAAAAAAEGQHLLNEVAGATAGSVACSRYFASLASPPDERSAASVT